MIFALKYLIRSAKRSKMYWTIMSYTTPNKLRSTAPCDLRDEVVAELALLAQEGNRTQRVEVGPRGTGVCEKKNTS